MKAEYLNKIIEALIELIDEGVYIVDQDGVGKFYNKAMASMEKVNIEDVLGKKFHEAFPDFSLSESTMFEALKKNNPTLRKQQTYKNLYGKEITTINSTIPIIADGKTVAAVEVAKDITNIRKMSDTLLELTEGKREPRAEEDEAQPVGIKRYTFDDIYGENQVFRQVITRAKKAALNDASVFIYGETGTGKEMFAQSIHNASPRRDGPFVAINCTALNRNLLESELFGYADSSFTGARRGGKAGLFETAHGGTIFLDEIGELPLEFQAPLLRVLQEKEVRRVGDDTVIPVDIRIIGATNRDLLHLVEEGRFRRDLYYRLNVLSVLVPPLRERGDDYLEIARAIYDRVMPQRSADEESAFFRVLGRCRSYAWPGNVRELTNTVERVSLLLHRGSPEEEVFQSLKMNLWRTAESAPAARERTTDPATDKSDVLEALRRSGGNASRAAKDLGISRSTLYRRLKQNP